MTKENEKLRDCLRDAESIITNALRSQPEGDDECKRHLTNAVKEVLGLVYDAIPSAYESPSNAAMRDAILGNNAAIRKAMSVAEETANELLSWCSNHYQELNCMGGRIKRALESAANAPWRNCDRFGGDIGKLREACARERGLNPDEDFPEVFCEWLLAPVKKGDNYENHD